jgi:hypothetical protein
MKLILILLAGTLMMSCASADKMLERGDYQGLISYATKKLSGKKKRDVYVLALEEGFEKMIRRDMARIEAHQHNNTPGDWEAIIRIARDIENKQNRIEPFLPLISESGYQAKFTFVKTQNIIAEAKSTAVLLHEKRLEDLVMTARKGNKNAAREAYHLIDHIRSISPDYRNQILRDEMWDRGINKVLVRIENQSGSILPPYYEEELLSADLFNDNRDWDRFYSALQNDMQVDYEVVLRIQEIATSPEEWIEHPHIYTKEVKDGWEYVLDERGNVAKDSLGNDIKRDKFVKVQATVVETIQSKRARVHARMDIVNKNTGTRVFSQPLDIENHFSHTARNFFGDERALDNHLRTRILPVSYPADMTLILDAFKAMKPKFFAEVRRYNYNLNS